MSTVTYPGRSVGAPPSPPDLAPLSSTDLATLVEWLSKVDTTAHDAELIDQITQLERMKSACAAAQATLTLSFVASQSGAVSASKARDDRIHRSIAGQIALARRDSPFRGGRHVGLAKALIREMPHAYSALRVGDISEWRATLLVRETACLSAADRTAVDEELAGRLADLGDRQIAQAAARIAQRLDPEQCVARNRKAVGERRVSIRPAPDTMAYVTGLLPVAQAVAVWAALTRHATAAKATGDLRTHGQLMADEMVSRISAHGTAAPPTVTAATAPAAPGTAAAPPGTGPTAPGPAAASAGTAPAAPAAPLAPGFAPDLADASPAVSTVNSDTVDVDSDAADSDAADSDAADSDAADSDAVDSDIAASDPGGATDEPTGLGERTGADGTGESHVGPGCVPVGVGLDIQLVMTDRTLLDGDDEPAMLTGYGPIPAAMARQLVRGASPQIKAWIRRLFADPNTGNLISADSQRRTFSHAARQFLIARDQLCRTPWCDAEIRHADHVTSYGDDGPTRVSNGQGLCERCNYTKASPGWTSAVEPDGPGIVITTPTGHTVRSEPPPPPRSAPWAQSDSTPSRADDVA